MALLIRISGRCDRR